MLELTCATSNQNKLSEFRQASGNGIIVRGCKPVDCQETGDSFSTNALQKATCYYNNQPSEWLFADDSGLVVDALHGAPGIQSARYSGLPGDDHANNRVLLKKLAGLPRQQRTARFICVIVLLHYGKFAAEFHGKVEGTILNKYSGAQGFGYDPLFYFPPLHKSFGQVPADLKWEHSHRGNAYRAMIEWIYSEL